MRRIAAALFGGLLAAVPAGALEDLTGTWTGKVKCDSLHSGTPGNLKEDVTVEIIDGGPGVGVELEVVGLFPEPFVGFVVAYSAKPDRGILSGASCDFSSPGLLTGGTLQGPVKTKAGSEKASLRLTVQLMSLTASLAQVCVVTAKRVSTAAPDVPACTI